MVFKFSIRTSQWLTFTRSLLLAGLLVQSTAGQAKEPGQFYRYINDEGVKVISHSIPPEYAQKGYEIITRSGQVVKKVAAAPDPVEAKEEKERLAKERELLAEYEMLARRYSSEKEIYAARDRRLAHLNANLAILNSNINTLQSQIDELMGKAADYERNGRKIPAMILSNLRELREEQSSTKVMLGTRQQEHEEIFQEFEASVLLYRNGKALEASKALTNK